jgi:hypothetical protein
VFRGVRYSRAWLTEEHYPATGHYEELNVFGSPTGRVEQVPEGERLPSAPRGFTWRRIAEQRSRVMVSLITASRTLSNANC